MYRAPCPVSSEIYDPNPIPNPIYDPNPNPNPNRIPCEILDTCADSPIVENFASGEFNATPVGEQFLSFFKMTSYDFTLFCSFFLLKQMFFFFFIDVIGKEYYS